MEYSIGSSIWNGFGMLQNTGYPYDGILFSNLEKQNTDTCDTLFLHSHKWLGANKGQ